MKLIKWKRNRKLFKLGIIGASFWVSWGQNFVWKLDFGGGELIWEINLI
jgi:hypothetical protein